ncbi:hypothetical protein [Methylobacterium sp. WCS2018Hpa-22]|uniref:hypothetical protein n=1 Tax=Methylobacterium sp. WCS2018Hpa-22 TaxID=3073633 RepID=UPI002889F178|nr:hypothetical protein [Methylobacterium sp. WCS2018Hpa-22]
MSMTSTTTAALTARRFQAEVAVADAKAAAQAVLDLAPGTDAEAVSAARAAAAKAARIALTWIGEWLEHERDRADEALLCEGDVDPHAILAFQF